jgi:sec-independent protein translocase protein TatC
MTLPYPHQDAADHQAALPPTADQRAEELARMSLLEHLEELRKRLLFVVITLFVGFAACVAFAKPIYRLLARPIEPYLPDGLSFLRVTDPFLVYMKVALLAAVFVTSPILLYQLWRFVAPGLYRREKRMAAPFILFGSTFFLGGGLFGYFIAFPLAVRFLIELGGDFQPVITVDAYLNFLIVVLLGLGVMFELPIVIFMLSTLGVVTPRFLMRHFRWAVLLIFLLAAIITPTPDVFNLCVVALPTIVLYLLGVAAAAVAQAFKRRRQRREAAAAGA